MSARALLFTVDCLPSPLGRMLVVSDSMQRLRALERYHVTASSVRTAR